MSFPGRQLNTKAIYLSPFSHRSWLRIAVEALLSMCHLFLPNGTEEYLPSRLSAPCWHLSQVIISRLMYHLLKLLHSALALDKMASFPHWHHSPEAAG